MILIGLGANLPTSRFGPPRAALEAALKALSEVGIAPLRCSRWYESAPLPISDQPWYVNGVAVVETALAPAALLAELHRIERNFGRQRRLPNAPRTLDLDLLAYDDVVISAAEAVDGPVLPHPRLAERAFVLLPLAEVAPGWRHPVSGECVEALIARLPEGQELRPLGLAGGR